MLPATHDMIDALAGSLDNLVHVATSDRTTVQQLTLANLSLTMSVATLMAANKKLTKMVACYNLLPQGRGGRADALAKAPTVVPKQSGETIVGCMGTRSCILARPAV
jgi:hypothetical protein